MNRLKCLVVIVLVSLFIGVSGTFLVPKTADAFTLPSLPSPSFFHEITQGAVTSTFSSFNEGLKDIGTKPASILTAFLSNIFEPLFAPVTTPVVQYLPTIEKQVVATTTPSASQTSRETYTTQNVYISGNGVTEQELTQKLAALQTEITALSQANVSFVQPTNLPDILSLRQILGVSSPTTSGGTASVNGTDISVNNLTAQSLTVTSPTATSTFANGINLTGGCIEINGVCLDLSALSSSGIFSLNGLTSASQTFATSSDANIGLTITSAGSVHTFTPSWIGTLSVARGGTGLSSAAANQILIGNALGTGFTQIATSSLGIALSDTTGTLAITRGGTGITSVPTFGQLLMGDGAGHYTLVATSSLGITASSGSGTVNSGTAGQVAYYAGNGTAVSGTSVLNISGSNVGIGTTSPFTTLSVAGSGFFTGNLTAANITATGILAVSGTGTSTFGGGIQTSALNVTSTTASSTFANGINLSAGCFAVNGTCVGNGGITSIGPAGQLQSGATQTFATSSDTNLGLTITASGNTETFTPSWIGVLAAGRGGTGISSVTANQLLIGNSTGTGWTQVATSSLGLLTTNVNEGTNLYYTDTRVNNFVSGSSTIPKTYTSNTYSGLETFNGGVTVGNLTGPLQGINGVVSASSTLSIAYGGTGVSTAPSYGQILVGNSSSGYSLTSTSSLGLVTSVAASGGTTGLTFSGTPITNSGTLTLSGTLVAGNGGTGISNPSAAGILLGSYAGGGWQQIATSSLGLVTTNVNEGTNLYYTSARVISLINASTTIPKTYTSNTYTAAQTFNGGLTIGNLTGPLQGINGAVSATSTLSVAYGGTGISTAPTFGQLLVGNSTGGYTLTSTSSLGIVGSQWTVNGSSISYSTGNVGIGTTSPATNLSVAGNIYATNAIGIGSVRSTAGLTTPALTVTSITSCSGSQALQTDGSGNVSCGLISAGGGSSSGGGWTANGNFVALATTTNTVGIGATTTPYAKLSILSGSNATTTLALVPASGQTANILDIYNTSNVLNDVITASGNLGIGTTSPGSLLSIGTTNGINFSTGTSTFSSTGGINLSAGCFAVNGTCIGTGSGNGTVNAGTTGQVAYYASNGTTVSGTSALTISGTNVGIGTTSPWVSLGVNGAIDAKTYYLNGSIFATSTGSNINYILSTPSTSITNPAGDDLLIGNSTGGSLTTGNEDVFVGPLAGSNNTTGNQNTFVGSNAGRRTTTGGANFFGGYKAGDSNLTGSQNIGLGSFALDSISAGGDNIGIGYSAGFGAGDFSRSIFIGTQTGFSISGANDNVLIGYTSGTNDVTGSGLTAVGNYSLLNTTAASSTALGFNAGKTNTSGTFNTFLGYGADASTGGLTNATAIGANAIVSASNSLVLGNGVNVGIGTSSPSAKLALVNGGFLQGFASTTGSIDGGMKVAGSVTNSTSLNLPLAVYVSGKYAYVAADAGSRLTIVDISNPSAPIIVGSLNDATNLSGARSVTVSGKYAYIAASGTNRLTVVDVSNPTSPVVAGSIADATNLNGPTSVYVSGKYVYVTAQGTNRLTVVDVSNPASPTIVGSLNDGTNLNNARSVYVSGKYAYVAVFGNSRLTVVDISNPTSPVVAGSLNDGPNLNGAVSVYVSGKYAYIAASGTNRLTVVDISNPTSPVVAGSIADATNLNSAESVYVSGKYAYVAAVGSNRLTVVDVSNPTSPVVAGSLNDATNLNFPIALYVSGKYAYVATEIGNSLTIVDLGGVDSPAANIGNIASNDISVSENIDIGNNADIHGGLNVGVGGILSDGAGRFNYVATTSLNTSTNIGALSANIVDSTNGGIVDAISLFHTASTSPTSPGAVSGIGTGLLFGTQDGFNNPTTTSRIASVLSNVTTGASYLSFSNRSASGAMTEFMRLDQNGNLGIGTTSPYAKLSVVGQVVAQNFFATSTNATSTFAGNVTIGSGSIFASNGSLAGGAGGSTIASGSGSLAFGDSNFSGGGLTASGAGSIALGAGNLQATNVGSIALGYGDNHFGGPIVSSGNGSFAGGYSTTNTVTASGNGSFAFGDNLTASNSLSTAFGTGFTNNIADTFQVGYSSTPTLTVNATSVGIGTSSPDSLLTIYGNATGASRIFKVTNIGSASYIGDFTFSNPNMTAGQTAYMTLGQGATANNEAALGFYNAGSGSTNNRFDIWFNGQSAPLFTVRADGNIGIGTTSPFANLSVAGSAYIGGNLTATGTLAVLGSGTSTFANGINLSTGCLAINGTCLSASGTVNAGTTGQVAYYPSNGTAVSGTSALSISGSNVGIGTSSPWVSLGVNGAVDAQSYYLQGQPFGIATTSQNYYIAGASPTTTAAVTGQQNIFIGYQSGLANSGGSYNTAEGYQAFLRNIFGNYDTALGYNALVLNTIGSENTATGYQALALNTTGSFNTANGHSALFSNTTGGFNTAVGYQALNANTTAGSNAAFGGSALVANTTGQLNTAIGTNALDFNVTGSALTGVGYQALHHTTAASSTALGYNSGFTNTTGTFNTFLGYGADAASGALTNATAIGANAIVGASNSLVLGGTGANAVNVGIGTTTPGSLLSIGTANGINFSTGTSTFSSTGGINLTNGCFAVNGTCLTAGSINNAGTTGQVPYYAANGTTLTATSSLFINANGNVGVGTTSLGNLNKLTVAGNIDQKNIGNVYNVLETVSSSGTDVATEYAEGSSEWFVGMLDGTLSPTGAATAAYDISYQANNPSFTVLTNGNVGVGTTTPWTTLSVGGNVDAQKYFLNGSPLAATAGSNINYILSTPSTSITNPAGDDLLIGNSTGGSLTTGNEDVFVGPLAGSNNTTGNQNTFVGSNAGRRTTTGGANFFGGYKAGDSNLTGIDNIGLGAFALDSISAGSDNIGIGYSAGFGIGDFSRSIFIGTETGFSISGASDNVLIGYTSGTNDVSGSGLTAVGNYALLNTTAASSTALGFNAGKTNTSGTFNTFLGYGADAASGALTNATAIGANAIVSASNSLVLGKGANVGIGTTSPFSLLSVAGNAYIGGNLTATGTLAVQGTGTSTFGGSVNLSTGCFAMNGSCLTSGSGVVDTGVTGQVAFYSSNTNEVGGTSALTISGTSIGIGTSSPAARFSVNGSAYLTAGLGVGVVNTATGTIQTSGNVTVGGVLAINGTGTSTVGNISASNINASTYFINNTPLVYNVGSSYFIGNTQPTGTVTGTNNFAFGSIAGAALTSGSSNLFMGNAAGTANTSGSNNIFLGGFAGNSNQGGNENIFLGDSAGLSNTSGSFNIFQGANAGISTNTGGENIFIGDSAGFTNTSGSNNILEGFQAGYLNVTGNALSALGYSALRNTTGASSTALGYKAGFTNTTGTFNTFLGIGADAASGALTNATAIGANAIVSASNSLVLGNGVNVGIGTSSPSSQFAIASSLNGTTGNSVFTMYDSSGVKRTSLNDDGTQLWNLGSNVGQISYSTPSAEPGIVIQTGSPSSLANRFDMVNIADTFYLRYNANGSGLGLNIKNTGDIYTLGKLGVGTTSPYAALSVAGLGVFNNLFATSTTATTTLAGGLDVASGALRYDLSSGVTSVSNLQVGATNFDSDAGIVSWVDMPVTTASASSTVESYSAQLNSNPILTVYGLADGSGNVNTLRVGIGTTSPASTLTVTGSACISQGAGATVACATTPGHISAVSFDTGSVDLAENYPTQDLSIGAGDIVAVDTANDASIIKASGNSAILGVVSTQPGFVLGYNPATSTRPVALAGRVPVKVSMENGPINRGDYLTISSKAGVAMKASSAGGPTAVIGTALQNATTDGTILVFVRTGFADINLSQTASSTIQTSDNASLLSEFANVISGTEQWMYSKITASTGFFGNLFAHKITTQQLCVGDTTDQVCVNKDQLKQLLQQTTVTITTATTTISTPPSGQTSTTTTTVSTSTPIIISTTTPPVIDQTSTTTVITTGTTTSPTSPPPTSISTSTSTGTADTTSTSGSQTTSSNTSSTVSSTSSTGSSSSIGSDSVSSSNTSSSTSTN